MDILQELEQISIRLYENCFVAPSKQRAVAMMDPVVALGIDTIDVAHAPREVSLRCLNQEMVVVDIRQNAATRTFHI